MNDVCSNSSDVNKAIQAIAEKELSSLRYSIINFSKDTNNEDFTVTTDLVKGIKNCLK